eukprot:1155222-Pelagomonas_calceolata.AAC.1
MKLPGWSCAASYFLHHFQSNAVLYFPENYVGTHGSVFPGKTSDIFFILMECEWIHFFMSNSV